MRANSLDVKFSLGLAAILACILAGVLLGVRQDIEKTKDSIYTHVSQMTREDLKKILVANAIQIGSSIKAELEVALDTVRTLSYLFGASVEVSEYRDPVFNRTVIPKTQIEILKKFPHWTYVYSQWAPDAAIGWDANWRGLSNHDAQGRFLPVAERTANGYQSRTDHLATLESPWYTCPVTTGKDCLTDPLRYEVAGKKQLMTKITSPIYAK
ncbi:hypothetical protein SAMN05421831_101194 [Allopseudospirillum japonicum]|uniref:Methyl-accepting chemotaxis protein n=1 Tax=Allopseudospirillum japonicum TaxID=64971 RepID=A0A1H6QD99_9GAMM|nr:cache domain-containing protein [Allopseudospirillum japonicum]SEI38864.1 hypothetical protein SAMN05421831_101194 [Allopseudospirillum japonicum]